MKLCSFSFHVLTLFRLQLHRGCDLQPQDSSWRYIVPYDKGVFSYVEENRNSHNHYNKPKDSVRLVSLNLATEYCGQFIDVLGPSLIELSS